MARTDTLTNFLTDVSTAIKTKKGDDTPILASNFDTEITNLPSGGVEPPTKGFTVDELDSDGYATKVTVYGSSIPNGAFGCSSSSYKPYLSYNLTDVSFNEPVTKIGKYAFRDASNLVNIGSLDNVTSLGESAFMGCSKLKVKSANKVTMFYTTSFSGCSSLIQMSMESTTGILGGNTTNGAFYKCTSLKAVWIGSSITDSGFSRYSFNGCTSMIKMFIDLPRATVETFTNYQYTFMNNANKTGIIVCNDDEGFITREEFDAIDWAAYTE